MKPTPIELEMPMGKDIYGVEHREPYKAYDIDEVDLNRNSKWRKDEGEI